MFVLEALCFTLEIVFELTLYFYFFRFSQKRVYPCSSFWNTLSSRWNELNEGASSNTPEGINLPLLHPLHKDLHIACGEIDGAVLGSWTSIIGHPVSPEVDNDTSHASYWTAAAVWSDAWDHLIINRVSYILSLLIFLILLEFGDLLLAVCSVPPSIHCNIDNEEQNSIFMALD